MIRGKYGEEQGGLVFQGSEGGVWCGVVENN